jgi:formylglycine-generating enzyme
MRRFWSGVALAFVVGACSKQNNLDLTTNNGGAGASGAGVGDEGASCKSDGDCSSSVCLAGQCRVACDAASGCQRAASVCLYTAVGTAGGCSLEAEGTCATSADCGPFACGLDGRCRPPCTAECKQGQYCVEGACYDKSETGKIAEAIACIEEQRPAISCEGAQIVLCNAPGKPGREQGETCATPALCESAVKASRSSCDPAVCAEGSRQCNPTTHQIEECSKGLDGHVPVQGAKLCASSGLCELVLAGATKAAAPVEQARLDAVLADCAGATLCDTGVCFQGSPYACKDKAGYAQLDECSGTQCDPTGGRCFVLKVDAREVSRASYQAFLEQGPPASQAPGCSWNKDLLPDGISWPPSPDEGDLPVAGVDWCDAAAYCAAHEQRLCGRVSDGTMVALEQAADPGQSEWMNACTSGGELPLSYGDQYVPGKCNTNKLLGDPGSPDGKPSKVAEYAATCASPRATYKAFTNLIGNVAEWENACEADAAVAGDGAVRCLARGGDHGTEFNQKGCDVGAAKGDALPRSTTSAKIGFRCCG